MTLSSKIVWFTQHIDDLPLAMGQWLKVLVFRFVGRHTFGELVCALIST